MPFEFAVYLDAFVAAADLGSFSAAARRLGLTPAAVSKSVARLEAGLGVRLFQRSTRSLSLTEEGERLYRQVRLPWGEIGDALTDLRQGAGKPAGTLKVSLAPTVGRNYVIPMLSDFAQNYPAIVPDLHFDNRQVDLVAEGFDVAIGGGVELTEDLVARELARVKIVLVASPAYLERETVPRDPSALARHQGLMRRSVRSGRIDPWTLRNDTGEHAVTEIRPAAVFDDPEAIAHAAAAGMGIALLPVPHVLPLLASGQLVRILPAWYTATRPLSVYYSSRKLVPAKVRVFVDFVIERSRAARYADLFWPA